MNKLIIDNSGKLQLPVHAAREIGSRPLRLVSCSDRHLLLSAPAGPQGEMVLGGTLGEVTVTDLLSFFNMFRKTGMLRFALSGGSRDIYFQKGEIVFAASSFPEEDLGEVLHGLGKLGRDVLQKVRRFVTPQVTLGKVLVERGVVTPKDLWQATRHQVEMIVYNLFPLAEGSYAFFAGAAEGEVVRLSMGTQNLIMEGLRRVDERALFMRRLGSFDAVPVATGKPGDGLPVSEKRLLALAGEGKDPLRDILRKAGMGELDGLRLLYQLAEKGFIRMEEKQETPVVGDLLEILTVFNGVLTAIFRKVAPKAPGLRQEIHTFLRDLPQPFSFVFRDTPIQADGSIDGGRLLANLAGLEEGDKKKLLIDAMNELVYMECIIARRELKTAESTELVQRVQEISQRVKNLCGRQ
jgi:hypothetical protein